MKYSEMTSIEAGQKFKTQSGLIVETTGATQHIESTEVHVHEVTITEGTGQGYQYWYNLDNAEKL